MTNERLRMALERTGVSYESLAREAEVDPKTVHRWVAGRVPRPRHRHVVANRLDEDEEFLWPGVRGHASGSDALAEITAAYAYRSDLETRRWWSLFERAEEQIDLLGYTLYFLPIQHPALGTLLSNKAKSGCRIRITIADPASPHVRARDREEHQAITLVTRIQSTLAWIQPLLECDGLDVRFQDAALYSSVFRFDDSMLVTPHLYAIPGHAAPLLELKRLGSGGLFARFEEHFEAIWIESGPVVQDRGTHLSHPGAE